MSETDIFHKKLSRRDFLKLSALWLLSGCASRSAKMRAESFKTEKVYIPKYDRLNNIPLPQDTLMRTELWLKYKTRVWGNGEEYVHFRPGLEEADIFKALLAQKQFKSLDIILLGGNGVVSTTSLTDEQRSELPTDYIDTFRGYEEANKGEPIGSGMYFWIGDRMYVTIGNYTNEASYNYPTHNDYSQTSTGVTTRHELYHFGQYGVSDTVVGYRLIDAYRSAKERLDVGDDSGYWLVVEDKHNLLYS